MFCAGTGLAPFHGFIQQRAIQQAANPERPLAPAIIFIGCRSATRDRLYATQMDAWSAQGVIDVRYAFSQEQDKSEGCAYVQDRILKDAADVVSMWQRGARCYVCGSGGFVKEVGHAARDILREKRKENGTDDSEEALEAIFKSQLADRCATDVFG
jgi:cytochrome P450/NADPH-cytochrome P450 reductase